MNIQTAVKADKAELQRLAREEAYSTPLKDFHPGAPRLFQNDTLWPWFERLRKEEPVHYCTNSPIEPYWSVTKYNDIMHVDTNHGIFSSDATRSAASRSATRRSAMTGRASSRWTSRGIRRNARPCRRCSRRRISTSWQN